MFPRVANSIGKEQPELVASQLRTVSAIDALLEQGNTSEVIVWGISGSGKSAIAEHYRRKPGINVHEDGQYSWSTNEISITFKTGLPQWLADGDCPANQIFHQGFSSAELFSLHDDSSTYSNYEISQREIYKTLSAICFGSLIYAGRVVKAGKAADFYQELAGLFAIECQRAKNEKPCETFDSLIGRVQSADTQSGAEAGADSGRIERVRQALGDIAADWVNFAKLVIQRSATPVTPEVIELIKSSIFNDKVPPSSVERTISWYRVIPLDILVANETYFLLHSSRAVSAAEILSICCLLEPLIVPLKLSFSTQGIDEDLLLLDADSIGRKNGLYRFMRAGDTSAIETHQVVRVKDGMLVPIVSSSKEGRAGCSELFTINGSLVADQTLIFGGGDHAIDTPHVSMCLSLELILQSLQIPYEVWRGSREIEQHKYVFDGTTIAHPGDHEKVSLMDWFRSRPRKNPNRGEG